MNKTRNVYTRQTSSKHKTQESSQTTTSRSEQTPYPQNLCLDMAAYYKKHPLSQEQINFLLTHVEECVNTLPEKKREILRARYQDNRTYQDIATEYGRSGGRIRNIILECMEDFRHMVYMKFIPPTEIPFEHMDSISTRTWNALHRKDIHTINDLIQKQYTWDGIRRIRDLGSKGEQELRNCVARYHIVLPESD